MLCYHIPESEGFPESIYDWFATSVTSSGDPHRTTHSERAELTHHASDARGRNSRFVGRSTKSIPENQPVALLFRNATRTAETCPTRCNSTTLQGKNSLFANAGLGCVAPQQRKPSSKRTLNIINKVRACRDNPITPLQSELVTTHIQSVSQPRCVDSST
jgi:hypothetical protein